MLVDLGQPSEERVKSSRDRANVETAVGNNGRALDLALRPRAGVAERPLLLEQLDVCRSDAVLVDLVARVAQIPTVLTPLVTSLLLSVALTVVLNVIIRAL